MTYTRHMAAWLPRTVIVIACLSIGLYLRARTITPGMNRRAGAPRLVPTRWESKVMRQMRGDRARLQQTLDAKRVKYPRASRGQLLKMIHDEYVHDHH